MFPRTGTDDEDSHSCAGYGCRPIPTPGLGKSTISAVTVGTLARAQDDHAAEDAGWMGQPYEQSGSAARAHGTDS
jgi:hypothetical protein